MTRSGIIGIDHVLVAVHDLEAARMGWTRLGFMTSPRGKHLGRGTSNYCLMFERDYIELLGVTGPEPAGPEHIAFLAEREGPMKLAWATRDGTAAAASLAALGLHPDSPRDLSRQIELPEGTAVPRFSNVVLRPDETPGLSSFLCTHLTPELMRRREWLAHPNGATGLAGITVVVADTAPLVLPYERLFGAGAVSTTDDVVTVRTGSHRIIFATPDDFAAMYPETDIDPSSARPGIAALTLTVRDPEVTADYLTSWQVAFETAGKRAVVVPPEEANGAVLEFVAEPR
jgi:Glyoxalase-like domain